MLCVYTMSECLAGVKVKSKPEDYGQARKFAKGFRGLRDASML